MSYLPQEIIKNKRDGKVLTQAEIDFFIQGIANNTVSEGQIAAFAMAVYFQGMNSQERIDFTQSMVNSGDVMDWSDMNLNGPILDKHSTGGVGDKVSLMLAPIIAACGGYVPMISGRGLGHTGGTLDKFDAIPGYNTIPDNHLFRQTVKQIGCAIIGQTANLAPADKRFYATRDITATVDCIPLITASILSKKLAEGLDGLVMDVKTGSGAFMKNFDDAQELAQAIVNVSSVNTTAIITDMSQVIGHTAGNALEVTETIDYLTGREKEPVLDELVTTLCAEMLLQGKLASNFEEGLKKVSDVLSSGKAAEVFAKMVSALGGPNGLMENPDKYLAKSNIIQPIYPQQAGYIRSMDTRMIGMAVVELGGGRKVASDKIDYSVGFSQFGHIGDKVALDKPFAFVHANSQQQSDAAIKNILSSIKIGSTKVESPQVIIKRISP
ncbi:MAG: thymidine phosphorylase [Proteobacteria bacterium]|nr:thymidine phosphorylase [Pseudomonadota bacterium]